MTVLSHKTCTVDGCDKPHLARGLCRRHYERERSAGKFSTTPCQHDPCGQPATSRGFCKIHYTRGLRSGALRRLDRSLAARFWAKVDKRGPDECWQWTGSTDNLGYGRIYVGDRKIAVSSRVSWLLEHGSLPDSLHVLHHCDNPSCVNPKHLFLGTDASNATDKANKGRSLAGERSHFAKLTESEVRQIRRLAADGVPRRKIAKRYAVDLSTISNVVTRRTWRRVK